MIIGNNKTTILYYNFKIIIWCSIILSFFSCSLSSPANTNTNINPNKPIVYTIAGSDSGGGAGIQADLHAIHNMNCHGCSAITCLTAQSSVGVTAVHTPPSSFLRQQLDTLIDDLPPLAIKIGMLGSSELAQTVGIFLKELVVNNNNNNNNKNNKIWVVLDPVMISTSGHKLIEDDAKQAMIQYVFPYVDIITPNKFEAEELLGRTLSTPQDIEYGAKELLDLLTNGDDNDDTSITKSVLIKGGHTLIEKQQDDGNDDDDNTSSSTSSLSSFLDVQATLTYAQDYLISSSTDNRPTSEERVCDGSNGIWLRSTRWDTEHTHGTGCTLSSSIASALALGEYNRRQDEKYREGATSAIGIVDACCLAKAYVSAGIQQGVQLGKGPGPVSQTTFPSSYEHFPSIVIDPTESSSSSSSSIRRGISNSRSNDELINDVTTFSTSFRPLESYSSKFSSFVSWRDENDPIEVLTVTLGRILPIVDTIEWVEKLAIIDGITDIQLRIKDTTDPNEILNRVQVCQDICSKNKVRLWINDYWQAAIYANCFGVHFGQEDLYKCIKENGLLKLKNNNIALGISTHSYSELAVALGINPSYISLGPIYSTTSKNVNFYPQGLNLLNKWRQLIPKSIPLITIGGINTVRNARENKREGANCVAIIGAITKSNDIPGIVQQFNNAMN